MCLFQENKWRQINMRVCASLIAPFFIFANRKWFRRGAAKGEKRWRETRTEPVMETSSAFVFSCLMLSAFPSSSSSSSSVFPMAKEGDIGPEKEPFRCRQTEREKPLRSRTVSAFHNFSETQFSRLRQLLLFSFLFFFCWTRWWRVASWYCIERNV